MSKDFVASPTGVPRIVETRADRPEFRRIFVDTFSDEPSFRFMLPDDRARRDQVAWIVDKKLRLLGGSYHALGDEAGGGFAWWFAPGNRPRLGISDQLRVGYWQAPFLFGLGSFARMYRFSAQESRILRKYFEEPYWVLDVIATDPARQRSGLGGALMRPVFERSRRDGVPCFVLTHNARNVGFYRKYGFRLVIEEPVLGPGSPIAYGLERPCNSD